MINNVTRLPDAYAKDADSNNNKLFQLAYFTSSILEDDLADIADSRDLSQAYGATLDAYGAMFGVPRNGATDTQYRVKILSQIGSLITTGDANSVLSFIAQMLGVSESSIRLIEGNMVVNVAGLTMAVLQSTGYTAAEITEMIKSIMPIGVSVGSMSFAGTLLLHTDTLSGVSDYPTLYASWMDGQLGKVYQKAISDQSVDEELVRKVGLSGNGTVPSSFLNTSYVQAIQNAIEGFEFQASGTYEGGTLGIVSG